MEVKKETPTTEEQVAVLAAMNPLDYEKIRKATAKAMDVQVKTLDSEVKKARRQAGGDSDEGSQADIAVALFNKSGGRLFHDDEDAAFAEIPVSNHIEVWPVESKQFRKRLNSMFWNSQSKALREQSRKDAIGTLAGEASAVGDEHKVCLRAAYHDGRYYIDLCDDEWRVVEVDEAGWRVLDRSPVKFRRTSTMEALPVPQPGGDIDHLWSLLNVRKQDQLFILAWIIEALRKNTQFPVLEIIGGHGSAKSTVHTFIRRLVDPSGVDLRKKPKNDEDIWVAAKNNHCLSFENMSSASPGMQDTLCIVSTGGGDARRELYTNYDEVAVKALNPIIINGINPVITAGDLADRAVRIHVPKISDMDTRNALEIREAFNEAQQSIFSAILDIFVDALREIDGVTLTNKPRMLDFALLGEAVGTAIGCESVFNGRYIAMRKALLIEATQSSPAVMAIVEMVTNTGVFYGTYKDLLTRLDNEMYRSRGEGWPSSPRGLSGLITRHEPGLSALGFEITREEHGRVGNMVKIEKKGARQKDKESEKDVHDVHDVHKSGSGEGCEHCEGENPKENTNGARAFSDDQSWEEF